MTADEYEHLASVFHRSSVDHPAAHPARHITPPAGRLMPIGPEQVRTLLADPSRGLG